MDNPDLYVVFNDLPEAVEPLRIDRWPDAAARSRELTPLYVQRYVGPRSHHPPTTHPYWELTHVFRGTGKMVSEQTQALMPDRTLLIPSGFPHSESSNQSMDTLWVGVWGGYLQTLDTTRLHCVDDPHLTLIADQLWAAASMSLRPNGIELDALVRLMLGRILASGEVPGTDWTSQVLHYMHDHLHQPMTVAQLADAMACSEGYLHRRFKQSVGQTPGQALLRMRLDRASHLMQHTGLSIKQISRHAGFRDPLYFSRVFRKAHGLPPTQAAKQWRTSRSSGNPGHVQS